VDIIKKLVGDSVPRDLQPPAQNVNLDGNAALLIKVIWDSWQFWVAANLSFKLPPNFFQQHRAKDQCPRIKIRRSNWFFTVKTNN
jgi:hypothetical protein